MGSFRSHQLPLTSKKLNKLVKSENSAIDAHEAAGRERVSIASQLSDWGESTEDDAVSDISDRLGVLLAEIGEQEDAFSMSLEDYRNILKQIRDTETSVQPSRDTRAKIMDEIEKLKYKEPGSPRLVTLEQELVRAEAQCLVAEAQLTNVVSVLQTNYIVFSELKFPFSTHLLTVDPRREQSSSKPLTFTWRPQSNVLKSRISLHVKLVVCSTTSTTLQWSLAIRSIHTGTKTRLDRSSKMQKRSLVPGKETSSLFRPVQVNSLRTSWALLVTISSKMEETVLFLSTSQQTRNAPRLYESNRNRLQQKVMGQEKARQGWLKLHRP